MIKGGLTQRYAQALYDLALEKQQVQVFGDQLHRFVDEMEHNAEFNSLFCGKLVPASAKKQVVEQIFGDFAEDIKNFIFITLDKNREASIPQIVAGYDDLCDAAAGIRKILVHTAVPLEQPEAERLQKSLEQKLGGQVRLKTSIDTSMIGGLKVQIDDTIYDASLLHQLNALKQTLSVE